MPQKKMLTFIGAKRCSQCLWRREGKAASPGSPWGLAQETSWTVRKKGLLEPESGDRARRGGGAGRTVRKEGGGPAGRPPGRPPDAVNNSHRRTEDSLQARGIGPGRKSADVWRGLVVFPVCKPRILVALAARKAQSQVPLPALREGAPRNCPDRATCRFGSHLCPAVPMATGWPGPGFTA